MKSNNHVFVAISGGVDSAVAAAILLEQGHQVTGIHMKTWQDPRSEKVSPHSHAAISPAQASAQSLNIPFISLDLQEKFYQDVVQPFISKYLAGLTPNPCLFCNPQIKWGILQTYALTHGADYFATGHYARIENQDDDEVRLLRGVDKAKDQSYVLSMLTQDQLRKSLFPLGILTKDEVRDKARDLGLASVEQEESQDLCFLPQGDYREFLQRYASKPIQPGDIVDQDGKVLGQHQGLAFYTIGQRKGIRIAAEAPYYVIGKDQSKNQLEVGFCNQAVQKELLAEHPNWISGRAPRAGDVYDIMVRYRSKPVPGVLTSVTDNEFRLEFNQEIRGITPGQVAVLYRQDECLGGGIIKMAH